jgi:protein ImuB
MAPRGIIVENVLLRDLQLPESLKHAIEQLTESLCAELGRQGLGARRLDLLFRRVDGQARAMCVGTAAASRDATHLAKLLCARLAGVDPGFGIEEATLTAGVVEPLAARQGESLGQVERDGADVSVLVDRLGVRVGPKRLFRIVPVESDMPERSVRRVPALAPAAGLTWPAHLDRPTRLIDPPEPITATALVPDSPPIFFVWRSERHRVARADGPERVRGEWWVSEEELSLVRDYYRVETQGGGRFWIFRDAPMSQGPRWWLQGVFG